jgi:hypothetical protein
MKRLAGYITNAFSDSIERERVVSDNVRHYDSDPEDCRPGMQDSNSDEERINTRGGNPLERAYATGSRAAEIQYC